MGVLPYVFINLHVLKPVCCCSHVRRTQAPTDTLVIIQSVAITKSKEIHKITQPLHFIVSLQPCFLVSLSFSCCAILGGCGAFLNPVE